jgi:hypothetical protein
MGLEWDERSTYPPWWRKLFGRQKWGMSYELEQIFWISMFSMCSNQIPIKFSMFSYQISMHEPNLFLMCSSMISQ